MYQIIKHRPCQDPWNKGKLVGQKLLETTPPLSRLRRVFDMRGKDKGELIPDPGRLHSSRPYRSFRER